MKRETPRGGIAEGSSSWTADTKGTPRGRQDAADALHVLAQAVEVVARSGRARWALTARCGLCGDHHAAQWRGPLPLTLERPAACGLGRLVLHPVVRVAAVPASRPPLAELLAFYTRGAA